METPAPFDLNDAIRRWRQGLENSPALQSRDLEELESHLHDSVEMLVARGLTERDAFVVAVHRLGGTRELEAEFSKLKPLQVWSERAVWICCGLLGANMLWAIAVSPSNIVMNLGLWHGMNPHLVAALAFLTKWLIWGLLVALGLSILKRFSKPLSRATQACLRQPVWTGIVLILALEGIQLLPRYTMRLLEPLWQMIANPGQRVPEASQAALSSWLFWEWLAAQLFWMACIPLFAGYVWKRTRPRQHGDPAGPVKSLKPGERELMGRLRQQGLSAEEAGLVGKGAEDLVANVDRAQPAFLQNLWLERGLWMLVGAVAGRMFVPLVLEPSSILLTASSHSSSIVQHLAGLGAMSLCLAAIAGILLGLRKGIATYPHLASRFGRTYAEHPGLAVLLTVTLLSGFGASLYFLERTLLHGLPGQHGISSIGSSWLEYTTLAAELVLPVALLVWSARKRATKPQSVT